MPTIHAITRRDGIAGNFAITAQVQYPDEPVCTVGFVGSTFGGPIVMLTESGMQVFVDKNVMPELTEPAVREFFTDKD